ncbi:MAG: M67 family metallopeptidase [Acidobacteria bacterium]|nr:M67 family metallopeptidase [Acidobacteriota bacterium]
MPIHLQPEHVAAIRAHGERTYPEECGGLLLGILEGDDQIVREIMPLDNIRNDSRHNRVELSPLDYARAEREAGRRNLGVWGYYHSHPDHPAVPSSFDLEHAPFTEWSYLIVSIRDGKAADLRAWSLRTDRSQFDEKTIVTASQYKPTP